MARKYDVTRFIFTTEVTGKTINDDLEVTDVKFFYDGKVQQDEAIRRATKESGVLKKPEVRYLAGMYGITTKDMILIGEQLNPYTRQPWNEEEDRDSILNRYIKENIG